MIDYKKLTFNSLLAGLLAGLAHYQAEPNPVRALQVGLFVALGHSTGLYQPTPVKKKKNAQGE